jgi:hypothetical protein
MFTHTPLRALPFLVAAATAAGQTSPQYYPLPTRGIMPADAVGFILSGNSDIQKKARTLPVQLTPTAPVDGGAHYSVPKVMAALPQGTPTLAIDAMSSGNDALPLVYHTATQQFRISQMNNAGSWAVLHLAIDDTSSPGSAVRTVMGYYFNNPSFPAQLRNGIYHELVPTDFDGAPGNIVAMDSAMGMLEDNRGHLDATSDPVKNKIYFSLTPLSASVLWASLPSPLQHVTDPLYQPPGNTYTGATIFVASFDTLGNCTAVRVCEDYETLGLREDADVDALGVAAAQTLFETNTQPLQPISLQFVFSTAVPVNGEELLVAADLSNGTQGVRQTAPLRGNNGDDITGGVGSLDRPVRAICSRDPENTNHGGSAYGEPEDHETTGTNHMSLSLGLARANSANGGDAFHLSGVVSGWGSGTPQNSLVYLGVQIVGGPLDGWTDYVSMGTRPADRDYFTFAQTAEIPWMGTWLTPGGATAPLRNRYRFWIYQIGLATSTASESIRELVYRRQ